MKSPLRTVMVPLDGSPLSERALPVAAFVARHEGATLHLVTVKPPVSTVPGRPGAFLNGATPEHALAEGLSAYLEEQADSVRDAGQPVAVTCTVLDGWIAGALADYSRDHDIDLIVMATHGWGGLKRMWLGSVTDELVRLSRCPALLLRPASGPPAIGIHRVLVALESTEGAEAILEPALALGTLVQGTHYTLLQVIEPQIPLVLRMAGIPARTGAAWAREVRDIAAGHLEHLAQRLRHRGIVADARVLTGRGTGEQILNFARRAGCDLIVVGTRGAGGVDRLVFGSVADKVLRGASQMVLVVPVRTELEPELETRREAELGSPT